jgi:hypothetical protein
MHFILWPQQFHAKCNGGHCLGTPQACTCDSGVGISTVLKIMGHYLYKGRRLWDHPYVHNYTLSDSTQHEKQEHDFHKFALYYHISFAIISHWRRAIPFTCTNLKPLPQGWSVPSQVKISLVVLEKSKMLQFTDKRRPEKLTWAFSQVS